MDERINATDLSWREDDGGSDMSASVRPGGTIANSRQAAGSLTDARCEDCSDRDSLYREFAPLVRRLIRHYGKGPEERQHLEREIYSQFGAHLNAYNPDHGVPLRPYIVRLLTASVDTFARRQWKAEARETPTEASGGSPPVLAYDPTPAWTQALSQGQVVAALPFCLSQLPARQRQVLTHRYYEQRSFEEIARSLASSRWRPGRCCGMAWLISAKKSVRSSAGRYDTPVAMPRKEPFPAHYLETAAHRKPTQGSRTPGGRASRRKTKANNSW